LKERNSNLSSQEFTGLAAMTGVNIKTFSVVPNQKLRNALLGFIIEPKKKEPGNGALL
jgi:hypothetical protein